MKKTIYFLLICFTGVLLSCNEDDSTQFKNDQSQGWHQKQITFDEFLKTEGNKPEIQKIEKYFQGYHDFNKDGDSINWEIDTTFVNQIITPEITTYTFGVREFDSIEGFRNVIVKIKNDSIQTSLIHYTEGIDFENHIPRPASGEELGTDLWNKSITCYKVVYQVLSGCSDGECEWGWELVEVPCGSVGGGDESGGGDGNGDGGGSDGGNPGTPTGPINGGFDPEGGGPSGGGNGNYSDFDYFLMDLSDEEYDWLNLNSNSNLLTQIFIYLENNNYYDNNAYDFALWAVGYLMENPDYKFTSLLNIKNELEENPYLLLTIPCSQFPKWMEVINYSIPQQVNDRITQLNQQNGSNSFYIQKIEDADGPIVNMDFFPVTITQFPNNISTGQPYTPSEFFQWIRKFLDAYLDGGPASFSGYNSTEDTRWMSNNYLTSLMRFDIQVNNWLTQDGTVICIEQHPQHWKFATMRSPEDGIHPVSGIREFGYYQTSTGYVYYTRGVDRVKSGFQESIGDILDMPSAFEGADQLWDTFQQNLADFVNAPVNGNGHATINTDYKSRPALNDITSVLMGNAPISSLEGFAPCQ